MGGTSGATATRDADRRFDLKQAVRKGRTKQAKNSNSPIDAQNGGENPVL